MDVNKDRDPASLAALIADDDVTSVLREASPTSFDAASEFWRVAGSAGHLTPRMRELVLFAMHANLTALNVDAVERHVVRALAAGATERDLVDVLITSVGVANHALYSVLPLFEEELERAGVAASGTASEEAFEAAKQEFIASRGFWNPDRESVARLMPQYFAALNIVSSESWKNGSLTARERECICIAIDCTVTHSYERGLRVHIRNAIGHGAEPAEILEIFQLAATMGLEGYILAGRVLSGLRARLG
jgi:alkylhydroperoxidase/carboxymuconolactone decarboxylase family protein YurZ